MLRRWLSFQLFALCIFSAYYADAAWGQVVTNPARTGIGGGGGTGTVTSTSVTSGNGFAGTVATPTTTPAITLSTSVTGMVKGNGTALSAATAGTDYAPATSGATLLFGNGSGGFTGATGSSVSGANVTLGGALTADNGTVTTSAPVQSLSQTWNAAVTFTGKQNTVTATSANIDSVIEKWLGGSAGSTLQLAITGLGGTGTNGPAVVLPAGVLNSPSLSFGASNIGSFGAPGLYKGHDVDLVFGGASTAGMGFSNGNGMSINQSSGYGWSGTTSADTTDWDTRLTRDAQGIVQFNGGVAGTTKGGYRVIDDTTGASHVSTSSTELTTLNTGATTTATSGNLAAANSQIKAILLRVTTTITTAANFTVKVTGGNAFCQIGTATTSNTTLAANTTYVMVPCAHADAYVSGATTLTYTLNANPGAGAIRATVVYEAFTPPSS